MAVLGKVWVGLIFLVRWSQPASKPVVHFEWLDLSFWHKTSTQDDRAKSVSVEGFLPYYARPPGSTYCNPKAAPLCIHEKFGVCLEDDQYPEDDIKLAIELSTLADSYSYKSINKEEENKLTFQKDQGKTGCVSVSLLVKPLRAVNINGSWRVIIQDLNGITQRERVVTCIEPDSVCHKGLYFTPVSCQISRCIQQFSVRRLLAYDPCSPKSGAFIDSFRLPSACSCRYSRTPCL